MTLEPQLTLDYLVLRASVRAAQSRHRLTDKWRNHHNAYERAHRERGQAREAVAYAIRSGKMTRGPCECGSRNVEGHHYLGYEPEHWLDVLWRCRACHGASHREVTQ